MLTKDNIRELRALNALDHLTTWGFKQLASQAELAITLAEENERLKANEQKIITLVNMVKTFEELGNVIDHVNEVSSENERLKADLAVSETTRIANNVCEMTRIKQITDMQEEIERLKAIVAGAQTYAKQIKSSNHGTLLDVVGVRLEEILQAEGGAVC